MERVDRSIKQSLLWLMVPMILPLSLVTPPDLVMKRQWSPELFQLLIPRAWPTTLTFPSNPEMLRLTESSPSMLKLVPGLTTPTSITSVQMLSRSQSQTMPVAPPGSLSLWVLLPLMIPALYQVISLPLVKKTRRLLELFQLQMLKASPTTPTSRLHPSMLQRMGRRPSTLNQVLGLMSQLPTTSALIPSRWQWQMIWVAPLGSLSLWVLLPLMISALYQVISLSLAKKTRRLLELFQLPMLKASPTTPTSRLHPSMLQRMGRRPSTLNQVLGLMSQLPTTSALIPSRWQWQMIWVARRPSRSPLPSPPLRTLPLSLATRVQQVQKIPSSSVLFRLLILMVSLIQLISPLSLTTFLWMALPWSMPLRANGHMNLIPTTTALILSSSRLQMISVVLPLRTFLCRFHLFRMHRLVWMARFPLMRIRFIRLLWVISLLMILIKAIPWAVLSWPVYLNVVSWHWMISLWNPSR